MNINLKRFVNVDIVQSVTKQVQGARPMTVLYTDEGVQDTKLAFNSYQAVVDHFEDESVTATKTLAAAKTYFDNGGAWLYIVEATSTLTAANVAELPNEYINVTAIFNNAYTILYNIATTRAADSSIYGINEKIFYAQTNSIPSGTDFVKNFAVKYTDSANASKFLQMTMPAYLSQIDAYGIDTVHDYMFTLENVEPERNLTDVQYASIINANCNVDIVLANQIRNCGGNLTNGDDLVNNFMRIVLHQTLTDQLINLLVQKVKGEQGVSKIYSVITKELEKYKTNGYLTSDKIWDKGDLTIERNGVIYTLVTNGSAISNGYLITVLPFASLTEQEKQQRMCPYIYVIIADQYGIRAITIDGEVI